MSAARGGSTTRKAAAPNVYEEVVELHERVAELERRGQWHEQRWLDAQSEHARLVDVHRRLLDEHAHTMRECEQLRLLEPDAFARDARLRQVEADFYAWRQRQEEVYFAQRRARDEALAQAERDERAEDARRMLQVEENIRQVAEHQRCMTRVFDAFAVGALPPIELLDPTPSRAQPLGGASPTLTATDMQSSADAPSSTSSTLTMEHLVQSAKQLLADVVSFRKRVYHWYCDQLVRGPSSPASSPAQARAPAGATDASSSCSVQ